MHSVIVIDSFYTHNKEYKMCLCVNAAGRGDGKGIYLSLYLYLMKVPHDDELSWPLRGTFKIKLYNNHYLSRITCDDRASNNVSGGVIAGDKATTGWGRKQFISNESLYKCTYIPAAFEG